MNLKKTIVTGALVTVIAASSVAYAASQYKTPAEAAAGVTGKKVEDVQAQRKDGKTYGQIAKDAGKLDEFKKEKLELTKDRIEQLVKDGKLTKEKGDELIKKIKDNQANCDGTGSAAIGKNNGLGLGSQGAGQGNGGANRGQGTGNGVQAKDGTGANATSTGKGLGGARVRDASCA